jgi:hypothetical protein
MTFSGRPRRLTAAVLIAALAVFWSGCGGPKIESTSIDGTVRQIDNWEIEWVGDSTVTVDSVALRLLTDGQNLGPDTAFYLTYLSKVRTTLIRDHGLPFFDNLPIGGRIEVTIERTNRTFTTNDTKNDASRVVDDVMSDESSTAMGPFDREEFYRFNVNLIQRVNVRLTDRNDRLLGEVFIGDDGAKVKPDDVARAIANAIKEGRAKHPQSAD